MSKQALALLAKEIAGDSNTYRRQTLYKAGHVVDLRATSIFEELKREINLVQPELISEGTLSDQDIKDAASTFRRIFTGLIGPQNIEGNIASQVSYDAMYRKLKTANLAAFDVLSNKIAAKSKTNKLEAKNLIQLDHTRTSAETRYAQAFAKTIPDPVAALKAMHSNKYLSKEVYDKIVENTVDIISYYSGNSKTFELNGKVQVELRSGTANQDEGRKEVKERIDALKAAILKAKDSTVWPTQAASDSYKDFVFKTLTNAVINAGGTGTKQTLDTKANRATETKKTTEKIAKYSTSVNTTKQAGRLVASKPFLNLARIVQFINSRLPEAMRENMGPGSLNYRSGRLANSARVVGQTQTKQGFPSFSYTYARSPYDVFDPILGAAPWNTPGRDPRKLVEKSIRDIAKELAIGRFYLRRS